MYAVFKTCLFKNCPLSLLLYVCVQSVHFHLAFIQTPPVDAVYLPALTKVTIVPLQHL